MSKQKYTDDELVSYLKKHLIVCAPSLRDIARYFGVEVHSIYCRMEKLKMKKIINENGVPIVTEGSFSGTHT